ncbi:MAG: hypothetical protein HPY78_03505 [Brevinematales bacterium]|nr:hypothetical protein [Brevinematales bacterium]
METSESLRRFVRMKRIMLEEERRQGGYSGPLNSFESEEFVIRWPKREEYYEVLKDRLRRRLG